jgi:DNA-binding NtrC family response regulator
MSEILLVNDEKSTSAILTTLLKTEGYKIVPAADLAGAQEAIKAKQFDLMITNAGGGWDPELDLLKLARTERPGMPIVVLVDATDTQMCAIVAELKPFATIEKPIKVDQLLSTVQKAIDYSDSDSAESQDVNLNLKLETKYQFEGIVSESPAMKSVCDMISRVAPIDVTVLLFGANGTGKGVVARTIHANSSRSEKAFLVATCSDDNLDAELFGSDKEAGALRNASGGSLFLRDISSMSPDMQSKLLAILQAGKMPAENGREESTVNARIIASTSEDLEQMVTDGSFNADLQKALKVIFIKIPQMCDRQKDVVPTVRQVLQKKIGEGKALPAIDADVVVAMEAYSWPGNIKEMERVIEKVLSDSEGETINRDDLPPELAAVLPEKNAAPAEEPVKSKLKLKEQP